MEEIVTVWSNLADIGKTAGTLAKTKWDTASLNFRNWLQEPTSGITGRWFQGTTNADALNAGITGLFSALGTISSGITTGRLMKYYEQQEKLYLQNADEQARRIQLKGDIALRNLQIKHELSQGKQELAAAAGGGRLSGSNLDMLVQDYKVNVMDERTSSLQTLWEADNVKRQGYLQAISMAGQAMSMAYKTRLNALGALGKGLSAAVKDLAADAKTNMQVDYQQNMEQWRHTMAMDAIEKYYGRVKKTATGDVLGLGDAPALREKDYILGQDFPWEADATLQAQYDTASSTGLLPLIQVNPDGTPTITKMFQ